MEMWVLGSLNKFSCVYVTGAIREVNYFIWNVAISSRYFKYVFRAGTPINLFHDHCYKYIFVFHRARSIYERALDVDHRNITLWLRYTEMEMRNRQVNHARNLWDRAVTVLPRANQFWYKYTYMEETLGNIAG
jgi:tetratricopeptide (TPR) repeat protein